MAFEQLFQSLSILPDTYASKLQEGEEKINQGLSALTTLQRVQNLIDQATDADDTIIDVDGKPFVDLSPHKKTAFMELLQASVGNPFLQNAVNFFSSQLAQEQREKTEIARQMHTERREERKLAAAEKKQRQALDEEVYKKFVADFALGMKKGEVTEEGGKLVIQELSRQRAAGKSPDLGEALMRAGEKEVVTLPLWGKDATIQHGTRQVPLFKPPKPQDFQVPDEKGRMVRYIHEYDPETNSWIQKAEMVGVHAKKISSVDRINTSQSAPSDRSSIIQSATRTK